MRFRHGQEDIRAGESVFVERLGVLQLTSEALPDQAAPSGTFDATHGRKVGVPSFADEED